ncbi:SurA N-terminal domain-containing protein [Luteimonas sp. e5]
MLQAIREKSSGWVATVILGILIVPFALWGVNDYMGGRMRDDVAQVRMPPTWWRSAPAFWPVSMLWHTEEIGSEEFRRFFDQERMRQRAERGEAFDSREFESADNKRLILDQLIDQRLMQLAAAEAGFQVPTVAIRQEIRDNPDFQVDGRFDEQRYLGVLASQNPPMRPRDYEQLVREGLQRQALVGRLARSAFITNAEAERMLALWYETRDVSAVHVALKPAGDEEVDEAQIEAYYKANTRQFMAPETVTIEYVDVDAAQLQPVVPSEADLRARYAAERGKYGSAERREVAHILIPVAADADAAAQKAAEEKAMALAQQARAGGDFAALAKAESGDPGSAQQGGSLGWIERDGGMVKPFEDAVFALQAGAISDPVKTDFGWHVINVRAIEAGSEKSFEEVRDELEREALAGGRERAYNDLLSALVDDLMKNPSGFAEVAAAHKLPLLRLGPLPKGGGEGIGALPALQREAFSENRVQDGSVSDPVDIAPDRSVILRVVEHSPERVRPLADVRDQVAVAVRTQRAGEAAEASAKALLEGVRKGGAMATLAAAEGLAMQPLTALSRMMPAPTSDATRAMFEAPRPDAGAPSLGQLKLPDGSWLVFQVDAVHAADLTAIPEEEKRILRQQMAAAAGYDSLRAYVSDLRKRYKIRITDAPL